ncbi:hypothetical protein F5148DRAFT_1203178 [Russula earlei]|uniref:Uncharacterized protein n=1 Tax=Russula earlei TaxID=71964 RepID=A0ACC0U997_9AGAM|nr:hypothetical protein F5148DRAFT_1203178 [Russula earlei]
MNSDSGLFSKLRPAVVNWTDTLKSSIRPQVSFPNAPSLTTARPSVEGHQDAGSRRRAIIETLRKLLEDSPPRQTPVGSSVQLGQDPPSGTPIIQPPFPNGVLPLQSTIDTLVQGHRERKQNVFLAPIPHLNRTGPPHRQVAIEAIPYDVLLRIFYLYIDDAEDPDTWHTLVHVCQIWRNLVFASPHHLRLQLLCTNTTRTRDMLGIWPLLPIIISNTGDSGSLMEGADNIIAALEQRDRIRAIHLRDVPCSLLDTFAPLMHEPFPLLTSLLIRSYREWVPVPPDLSLCGSTPRLRRLLLDHIPLAAVQKLLLSANDLVSLALCNIPSSGHIPPMVMVNCLSRMTRLESLRLELNSSPSRFDQTSRVPPPLTRTVLPALDVIARIDVPLLRNVQITFFNQLIFDIPQLFQLICRCEKLRELHRANILFSKYFVQLELFPQGELTDIELSLIISCYMPDWQLSSLAQVCSSILPCLSSLEHIAVREDLYDASLWGADIEDIQWLDLLRTFTTVKNLFLTEEIGPQIASALGELTGAGVTEVLPALQSLFLENSLRSGSFKEAMRPFINARRHCGRPVNINNWLDYGPSYWLNSTTIDDRMDLETSALLPASLPDSIDLARDRLSHKL